MTVVPYVTRPADAALASAGGDGWLPLPSGVLVTRLPLLDASTGLYARLTYRDAFEVARRMGGRLPTREEVYELTAEAREHGVVLKPVTLSFGPEMVSRAHAETHDAKVRARMTALAWDGVVPLAGVGKHWVAGASPGKARIAGWWNGLQHIQGGFSDIHGDTHHDYATTTLVVRETATKTEEPPPVTRPTIRLGSKGHHVAFWQGLIGVRADGDFGPKTDAATRDWQARAGLVADGVVGPKGWASFGERHQIDRQPVDPRAPACVAALRDANAAWPGRRRTSDGIMADALHAATSDHAKGNAFDLSHDPANGVDIAALSRVAMADPRVQYIIANGEIWNVDRASEGWRRYTGANKHSHHMHVSVRVAARDDSSPWPWAP